MDCNKCVFNIEDEGVQTGCSAGRLQKLIDKGKANMPTGETAYELTQFCNMYREDECDLDKQRYNVMPLFGIVVSIKPEDNLDQVNELCENLDSLEYPREKLKIVLSAPSGLKYAQNLMHTFRMLKENLKAAELVLHLHNDENTRDNETFKKLVQATYFVKMGVNDRLDQQVFKSIDKLVNEELKQPCFAENNSVPIVLKSMMQQIYYNYESYEKAVEGLKTMSMEQDKYEKI